MIAGLIKAVPGSDINENPNLPEDPELQDRFNRAAVQVIPLLLWSHHMLEHETDRMKTGESSRACTVPRRPMMS